jgi:hypothetical protein
VSETSLHSLKAPEAIATASETTSREAKSKALPATPVAGSYTGEERSVGPAQD